VKTAILAGVALGILYTLSPLTVLSLCFVTALACWASKQMAPRERSWFLTALGLAITLRLAAIAALCVFADPSQPFATFFGDEEFFKNRTVWLRNVALGVPISPADTIYVFDEVGRSSYLHLLAFTQALVGDAPYGANVLNACCYVTAVIVLHWFVRRAYGPLTAFGGLILMLFLPSLFGWSISVLKEPLYILLATVELICAVQIVRAPTLLLKVTAALAVVVCAYALESVRIGGWLLAVVGSTVGVAGAVIVQRPRLAVFAAVAVPLLVIAVSFQPGIQQRVLSTVREAAFQHWGHVATPGHSYELLDPRLYDGPRPLVYTMTPAEAGRFVVRAFASFVTVPRPSQIQSRATVAYLPEQAVWYAVLCLLPIGVVAGLRREPVVTCALLAHGLVAAGMVALTGGNIGTLIRHRGLTLPYFCWLAALGVLHVIERTAVRHTAPTVAALPSGDHA
jgi:hypothetical protein